MACLAQISGRRRNASRAALRWRSVRGLQRISSSDTAPFCNCSPPSYGERVASWRPHCRPLPFCSLLACCLSLPAGSCICRYAWDGRTRFARTVAVSGGLRTTPHAHLRQRVSAATLPRAFCRWAHRLVSSLLCDLRCTVWFGDLLVYAGVRLLPGATIDSYLLLTACTTNRGGGIFTVAFWLDPLKLSASLPYIVLLNLRFRHVLPGQRRSCILYLAQRRQQARCEWFGSGSKAGAVLSRRAASRSHRLLARVGSLTNTCPRDVSGGTLSASRRLRATTGQYRRRG